MYLLLLMKRIQTSLCFLDWVIHCTFWEFIKLHSMSIFRSKTAKRKKKSDKFRKSSVSLKTLNEKRKKSSFKGICGV